MGYSDFVSDLNPEEEAKSDFETVPSGKYDAVITEVDWRENRAQTGHYLYLVVQIIGPTHAGMKVFDRLNLDNPNEKAVRIARSSLSQICLATGQKSDPPTNFLNLPLLVSVAEETDDRGKSNSIKAYYPAATSFPPVVRQVTRPQDSMEPANQEHDKAKAAWLG